VIIELHSGISFEDDQQHLDSIALAHAPVWGRHVILPEAPASAQGGGRGAGHSEAILNQSRPQS
jgi:hypothetical protein